MKSIHSAVGSFLLLVSSLGSAQTYETIDLPAYLNQPGPQTGTVAGGAITWSVDASNGWQEAAPDHRIFSFANQLTQTWTFSEPVNLEFSVAGLNCLNEDIFISPIPEAGDAEINALVIAPNSPTHAWDQATGRVYNAGGNNSALGTTESHFKLFNVQTLELRRSEANCQRGLNRLAVAAVAAPDAAGAATPVPVDGTWGLGLLAAMLSGGAAWHMQRRTRKA